MTTNSRLRTTCTVLWLCGVAFGSSAQEATQTARRGYYRFPALHGDTLVFTAEGDLWKGNVGGGVAHRLTSHPSVESHAAISPDGQTLAFSAQYEGEREVYSMPLAGGLPTRRTFEGDAEAVGWTPSGRLLYSAWHRSTLPDAQLFALDLESGDTEQLPLARASRGAFEPAGKTLFFTPLPPQFGAVKRYRGGTAQNLWKYTAGDAEAVPLTKDFPGVSREPMWWEGRIYFVSDRDGTMNLWSMKPDGGDLRQHTRHKGWDVKSPCLAQGRIAYQLGADLRILDLATRQDEVVPLTLASDFDQQREKWVKKPMDYVTSASLSPNGDRVVLTARGQVFVAPVGPGRLVEVTRKPAVRYRLAQFMPDGRSLLALSDESGEVEFEKLPANGVGSPEPLTRDGKVLRWTGLPRPTANGWRITIRTRNCGCSTSNARNQDGLPFRLTITSPTLPGRPTASGWPTSSPPRTNTSASGSTGPATRATSPSPATASTAITQFGARTANGSTSFPTATWNRW